MLKDGINSWTYVYDAENRITTAGSVAYSYDADGRRVKKSSGTNYWYGPSGTVLAETDSSGNWTNYILFAGQRLARNVSGDIKYYITDHLHSTAVFADKSGSVLDDNDFYPWGGVVPGVGNTTSNNTVRFTGKYRDTESQLDYFGARYYENATGRFMSPDWAAKPVTVPYASFGDPQSLNLYSYVRNSPIVRVDANGHFDDQFNTFGGGGDFSNIQSYAGMTATTLTYGDGSTQTIIHQSEGTINAGALDWSHNGSGAAGQGVADTAAGATTTAKGGAAAVDAVTQKLAFTTVAGCGSGDLTCSIQWILKFPSQGGGWIVQEISNSPGVDYWEAWQVLAGSQYTTRHDVNNNPIDDFWQGGALSGTVKGEARFYEGLELPSSFTTNNMRTMAHELPATDSNPNLPLDRATAPVIRIWEIPH